MKKTVLVSAILFALASSSMAETQPLAFTQMVDLGSDTVPTEIKDLINVDSGLSLDDAQSLSITSNNTGLKANLTGMLTVNELDISSVDSGIHINKNEDFVINANKINLHDIGYHSGIHIDSKLASLTVQKFKEFIIDATGTDQWDMYQGNGIRLNQGKFIKLEGGSIKITAAQSGVEVSNQGSISLSADTIEITAWGRGVKDSKPGKGHAVAVTGGGSISLLAQDKIDITNENVKGYENAAGIVVTDGDVDISSAQVTVNGKIRVDAANASNAMFAKLAIKSNNSTVNEDISIVNNGVLQLQGNLIFNGKKAEIGNLIGDGSSSFTITDASQDISITNNHNDLTIIGTGDVNDEVGISIFDENVTVSGSKSTRIILNEGMYSRETRGILDDNGNLKDVVTQTNTVMSNTLDLASAAPLAMNRLLINDVRKRMGNLRAAEGTHGVWARYDGGKFAGASNLENNFATVQVGIDTVPVADAPRFGIAFSYTKSDVDMNRGSADMDAFSLAFYGTKMYDNGMFVDVIGRMATADTDVTVDGNKNGTMDNVALSLSSELGWRFDVTDEFFFEPQAELTYTYVNADKLALSSGHEYEFDAVNSLMGRVGFATGFKCPNNFGDVYVRASVVHEFLGDAAVRGGSLLHEVDGKDTWVEYGIGANFNVNKNTYVYADIERTEGAALEENWRANVGVRFAF